MIDHSPFSADKKTLKQSLERVKGWINEAEQSRMRIGLEEELSNEPIVKTMYPECGRLGDSESWSGYKAWCQDRNGRLQVEAVGSTIRNVKWLTAELLELALDREPSKIFVTPLKPVQEGYRGDEARNGDVAVLMGHYVAIGERSAGNSGQITTLTMTNYLRIVSIERETQTRRGKNRVQESDRGVRWHFK